MTNTGRLALRNEADKPYFFLTPPCGVRRKKSSWGGEGERKEVAGEFGSGAGGAGRGRSGAGWSPGRLDAGKGPAFEPKEPEPGKGRRRGQACHWEARSEPGTVAAAEVPGNSPPSMPQRMRWGSRRSRSGTTQKGHETATLENAARRRGE
jgi:hypothetical protein